MRDSLTSPQTPDPIRNTLADTWLVTDNAGGTVTVRCKDGGQIFADFSFGHSSSTIRHSPDSSDKGTVSFNDGSGSVSERSVV